MHLPSFNISQAKQKLQQVFGYESFRLNQESIVESVIEGQDALVLMPTGGGKSLCYQIPALVREGTAVVVSPLIALMQDQVTALKQSGVRAEFLNSSLSGEETYALERSVRAGQIDLLYLSPERLLQNRTLNLLHEIKLSLFAIDEAHCVSRWGHDFRPEYQQLFHLSREFPNVPRIALTATADERTRQEIIAQLALENAKVFISSFDRPNINYAISEKQNAKQRLIDLIKNQHSGDAGIVYCLSRKRVDEFAETLQDAGFNALAYHAGMSAELRKNNQDEFIHEEGIIMVATIAFGMGIDKPNVRFVAHMDMPKSVEAYYQQTGRAGRDGLPSNAWMLHGLQDVIQMSQWINQSDAPENIKRVEHEKLSALVGLCETISCRRQKMLEYFGEEGSDKCGNCDNCQIPPVTWDATDAAQKALSAIARTGHRFGTAHIIDILAGTENEKVLSYGHHQLPVFGLGKDITKVTWRSVMRQLIMLNFVRIDVENYNVLSLREECRPILRGEQKLFLRQALKKADKKKKQSAAGQIVGEDDKELFEHLKSVRLELAHENGVPPYAVFHDKTLIAMAEIRPQTEDELLEISGVGQYKLEKYADYFLEAICEYL